MKGKKLYKSLNPVAFKCDVCGYTEKSKQAPKTCPLCKMEQGCFRIDITLEDMK